MGRLDYEFPNDFDLVVFGRLSVTIVIRGLVYSRPQVVVNDCVIQEKQTESRDRDHSRPLA